MVGDDPLNLNCRHLFHRRLIYLLGFLKSNLVVFQVTLVWGFSPCSGREAEVHRPREAEVRHKRATVCAGDPPGPSPCFLAEILVCVFGMGTHDHLFLEQGGDGGCLCCLWRAGSLYC